MAFFGDYTDDDADTNDALEQVRLFEEMAMKFETEALGVIDHAENAAAIDAKAMADEKARNIAEVEAFKATAFEPSELSALDAQEIIRRLVTENSKQAEEIRILKEQLLELKTTIGCLVKL